jgi:hypothetical protein
MQEPEEEAPGTGLSDQQQEALVQLGHMMGPVTDEFDNEVQRLHDIRHKAEHEATDYEHEFSDAKMHAAQTGGGGTGLGPEEEAQLLAKQQQTLQQRAAAQGQQQAQAAQAQQTSPQPPPAPIGPQGVSQPYPAQAGRQPPPAPAQEEEQ